MHMQDLYRNLPFVPWGERGETFVRFSLLAGFWAPCASSCLSAIKNPIILHPLSHSLGTWRAAANSISSKTAASHSFQYVISRKPFEAVLLSYSWSVLCCRGFTGTVQIAGIQVGYHIPQSFVQYWDSDPEVFWWWESEKFTKYGICT